MVEKNRWGIFLFSGAIALACGVVWLSREYPHSLWYDLLMPWIGVICSAGTILVGHHSYARVHSLKVLVLGYLTGICGIAYFLLAQIPLMQFFALVPEGFVPSLFILVFINFFIALLLPFERTWRTTLIIGVSLAVIEIIVVVMARFVPELTLYTRMLAYDSLMDPGLWIGPALACGCIGLSMLLLREEFFLGGLIAGCSLLFALAWCAPLFASNRYLQALAVTAAQGYIMAGIVFHWFAKLEHRISFDPLLHIYNRNYCSRVIAEQSKMNTRPNFGIAMVDIDHFKKVNDTYGHQAGDTVLFHIAQGVAQNVAPDGIACRYGGEELIVFFPQKTTTDLMERMELVRTTIEKLKISVGRKKISATVSIGISHREKREQSIMDVIAAADKALYEAKEGGRNQVKTAKASSGSTANQSHKKSRKPKKVVEKAAVEEDAAPVKKKTGTTKAIPAADSSTNAP